jgi:hypothetical protein
MMTYDVWFVDCDRMVLELEDVTLEEAEAYVAEESADCDPYEQGMEITFHGEKPMM